MENEIQEGEAQEVAVETEEAATEVVEGEEALEAVDEA